MLSTFSLVALVRCGVPVLADPVEVEDDAAPRDDDDEERQGVEEDHAQQEVEELGRAGGEGAEGDALPVPGELGVIPGTINNSCVKTFLLTSLSHPSHPCWGNSISSGE